MTIAFWNANGLAPKKTELEEFIQRLSFRNFRVYRTDREGARGGSTAILIKSTTDHHADLALDTNNIEATAITVNLTTSPIKLVAAYKAPNRQLLVDDLSEIFDTWGAVILRRRSQRQASVMELEADERSSTCLRRFADDFHLLVNATVDPMIFLHNGQPDILDIVVMKDVAQFHQLTVLNKLSSDHNPVLLQLGQTAREDEEPLTHHTVSWFAFTDHLSTNIGPIAATNSPIQLETAVHQVTERVSDSLRYATISSRAVDDRAFISREV
ncbi:hypothetical protein Trydic_g17639 [Trypoxylus dichotomus]